MVPETLAIVTGRESSPEGGRQAMPELTPELRTLLAQIAAHESWAKTSDRSARTAKARKAALDRFEQQVDPDGVLPPAERAQRAEHARKAHFQRLAFKSAQARRRRADLAEAGGSSA